LRVWDDAGKEGSLGRSLDWKVIGSVDRR